MTLALPPESEVVTVAAVTKCFGGCSELIVAHQLGCSEEASFVLASMVVPPDSYCY